MRFLSAVGFTLALESVFSDSNLRGVLSSSEIEESELESQSESQNPLESSDLFVYPELFGEYNLTSCSGAPSCGTTMTSYNGV